MIACDIDRFFELGGQVDEVMELSERGERYAVDFQYLMMNRWAFDRLGKFKGTLHDFASKVDFAAFAAALRPVIHYDIRLPDFAVPGLSIVKGDLTDIPLEDGSVSLASCLHVAEHIGLGRYGDEIDPNGFERACGELARVLAPGGNLLFAVPVGRPKVVFNAHRVLSSAQVLSAFPGLKLIEFSAINKAGAMLEKAPLNWLEQDAYGCGLFHFRRGK